MANTERQGMTGCLTLELRRPDGGLVERRRVDNLITSAGRLLVAQLFAGELTGPPELAIAVGGGATAPREQDTALEQPLDRASAAPRVSAAAPGSLATVAATLPPLAGGVTQLIQEAGILVNLPGRPAVLYNRVTFPTLTRTGNLEMTLTWEVTF
ncbi:hypothetical protein [uncultured Thiodictyon sp.]|uniref:hypothetical protein n=1 Tax=uncultured Thiodictyon sp. TaxID=1846217 RepID=UPI0025E5E18A|nr:hypothetical protein [uncultured Thiodictyon sp.]